MGSFTISRPSISLSDTAPYAGFMAALNNYNKDKDIATERKRLEDKAAAKNAAASNFLKSISNPDFKYDKTKSGTIEEQWNSYRNEKINNAGDVDPSVLITGVNALNAYGDKQLNKTYLNNAFANVDKSKGLYTALNSGYNTFMDNHKGKDGKVIFDAKYDKDLDAFNKASEAAYEAGEFDKVRDVGNYNSRLTKYMQKEGAPIDLISKALTTSTALYSHPLTAAQKAEKKQRESMAENDYKTSFQVALANKISQDVTTKNNSGKTTTVVGDNSNNNSKGYYNTKSKSRYYVPNITVNPTDSTAEITKFYKNNKINNNWTSSSKHEKDGMNNIIKVLNNLSFPDKNGTPHFLTPVGKIRVLDKMLEENNFIAGNTIENFSLIQKLKNMNAEDFIDFQKSIMHKNKKNSTKVTQVTPSNTITNKITTNGMSPAAKADLVKARQLYGATLNSIEKDYVPETASDAFARLFGKYTKKQEPVVNKLNDILTKKTIKSTTTMRNRKSSVSSLPGVLEKYRSVNGKGSGLGQPKASEHKDTVQPKTSGNYNGVEFLTPENQAKQDAMLAEDNKVKDSNLSKLFKNYGQHTGTNPYIFKPTINDIIISKNHAAPKLTEPKDPTAGMSPDELSVYNSPSNRLNRWLTGSQPAATRELKSIYNDVAEGVDAGLAGLAATGKFFDGIRIGAQQAWTGKHVASIFDPTLQSAEKNARVRLANKGITGKNADNVLAMQEFLTPTGIGAGKKAVKAYNVLDKALTKIGEKSYRMKEGIGIGQALEKTLGKMIDTGTVNKNVSAIEKAIEKVKNPETVDKLKSMLNTATQRAQATRTSKFVTEQGIDAKGLFNRLLYDVDLPPSDAELQIIRNLAKTQPKYEKAVIDYLNKWQLRFK